MFFSARSRLGIFDNIRRLGFLQRNVENVFLEGKGLIICQK